MLPTSLMYSKIDFVLIIFSFGSLELLLYGDSPALTFRVAYLLNQDFITDTSEICVKGLLLHP